MWEVSDEARKVFKHENRPLLYGEPNKMMPWQIRELTKEWSDRRAVGGAAGNNLPGRSGACGASRSTKPVYTKKGSPFSCPRGCSLIVQTKLAAKFQLPEMLVKD